MIKLTEAVEEMLDNRDDGDLHAEDIEMLKEALDDVDDDPEALVEAVDEIVSNRDEDYIHPDDREMLSEALASAR